MHTEIEVKFLDVNHDAIRKKLSNMGAELKKPMRLMRRVTIDSDYMKSKDAFLRVRDEGDKVTMTYKQFDSLSIDGAKEIEITVNSYNEAIQLLAAAGLPYRSSQESRRETWQYGTTEIVLDEWPWLKPLLEIEGESESMLRDVAEKIGLSWSTAVFGDVMAAYRAEYPHLGIHDTIGNLDHANFDDPLPDLLKAS